MSSLQGVKDVNRYVAAGFDLRAMVDRACRPRHSPTAVSEEVEDLRVAAREVHLLGSTQPRSSAPRGDKLVLARAPSA